MHQSECGITKVQVIEVPAECAITKGQVIELPAEFAITKLQVIELPAEFAITKIQVIELPDGRLCMREAAKYIGIRYSSLKNCYKRKDGPPHIKVANRIFFYREKLDDWIASAK
jgi:predicted DNA-binding transcriptional regulator AlpA